MNRRRFALVALGLFLLQGCKRQSPVNLGFESHGAAGDPTGWTIGGAGFDAVVDSADQLSGRSSLRSHWIGPGPYTTSAQHPFGVAWQMYPLPSVAGRRLHLSGYIRTRDITTGYVGLWIRVDGPSGRVVEFDNMHDRGVHGTTPWTRYDVELPVDSGASNVLFGMLHPGDGTAWFDSLSLEVTGPATPRALAAFKPDPRPAEEMTRLLTDGELAVPPDSVPVPENRAWSEWVRANAHPIRSLGSTDFSDLEFLAFFVEDKRIVQLGESAHGVAEFTMAKVRLIKYLHEQLGYDVLAFESSIYECERAQQSASTLTAAELMRGCIFPVWHVAEILPLFEYIKQTQATWHPLILAGFDEQVSSASLAQRRPTFFHDLIEPIDAAYARHVQKTDAMVVAKLRSPTVLNDFHADHDRFVAFYDSLALFLRANRQKIEAAHPDDPSAAIIARQTATSMAAFARQLAAGMSIEGTEIRDRAMADNLDVLLDELYPRKKAIVWAHNAHIQASPSPDTGPRPVRTMGVWVAERHRKEVYTVGLFMYRGSATNNLRQPYAVAPMASGSLESILHRAPWRYTFVDLAHVARGPGSDWMWRNVTSMEAGVDPMPIVPRDEYDGLLFIDAAHPPRYLPYR